MTFKQYRSIFVQKAKNAGYSLENINIALKYSEVLINQSLPVIYNTSHLSSHVGYNKKYIKRAVQFTPYFYRKFDIKKSNGNNRTIYEPLPSLKEIQYWVLQTILCKIKVSKYAKAYVPGQSIKSHVRFHRNQKLLVTLDISNFFGSIRIEKIEKLFYELGYSRLVSNLMAKLCSLNQILPQGAPTSPYISNIIFRPLDELISNYCYTNKIKYTRYADDMAFSGDFNQDLLIEYVSSLLQENDFSLNQEKTLIMKSNQQQLICGILVNKVIQVPRKKRDELKQAVYFIEKYGLEGHLKKINCQKSNYLKHLLGIANYILHINPKDKKTLKLKEKLLRIK